METPSFIEEACVLASANDRIARIVAALKEAYRLGAKAGYSLGTDFGWIDAQEQHYKDVEHE